MTPSLCRLGVGQSLLGSREHRANGETELLHSRCEAGTVVTMELGSSSTFQNMRIPRGTSLPEGSVLPLGKRLV